MSDATPRAPAGRPDTDRDAQDDEMDAIDATSDTKDPLAIPAGDRKCGISSVDRMVVEAELAAEGVVENPATPISTEAGEELLDRLDSHDDELVPAWTRPWEEGGDE